MCGIGSTWVANMYIINILRYFHSFFCNLIATFEILVLNYNLTFEELIICETVFARHGLER